MLYFFILFFILGENGSVPKKVKLTNNSTHKIHLSLDSKIVNEDFYKRLDVKIGLSGKILVFNEGNGSVSVYDSKGNRNLSFGRYGDGPGEFNSFPYHMKFALDDKYIYAYRSFRIMNYNIENGRLVKEIPVSQIHSTFFFLKEKNLCLMGSKYRNNKFISLKYSYNGQLLSSIKSPINKELTIEELLENKTQLKVTEDGSVQYERGNYRLEILDDRQNIIKIYSRDFEKVLKNKEEQLTKLKKLKGMKNNKMASLITNNVLGLNSKYEDDIKSIVGFFNSFLFVQTASSRSNVINIDVIDTNKDVLYSQIKIEGDKVMSASIQHQKLVLIRESDDDGLYVEIYHITIN